MLYSSAKSISLKFQKGVALFNTSSLLGAIVKLLVLILAIVFVGHKLFSAPSSSIEILQAGIFTFSFQISFALIVVLMVINWGIEVYKWKITIAHIEKITAKKAIKSVLAGVTISSFMPNRIGEYAGKVLFLKHQNKANGSVLALYGSLFQVISTLMVGIPTIYYLNNETAIFNTTILGLSILAFALLLVSIWVAISFEFEFLKSYTGYNKFLLLIQEIKKTSVWLAPKLLSLSIARLIIYSTQLSLLIYVLDSDSSFFVVLAASISSYLVITIVPSFLFADLGIREAVTLFIFSSLGFNEFIIVASTFAIWLINLAVPALSGAIIISLHRDYKKT